MSVVRLVLLILKTTTFSDEDSAKTLSIYLLIAQLYKYMKLFSQTDNTHIKRIEIYSTNYVHKHFLAHPGRDGADEAEQLLLRNGCVQEVPSRNHL